MENPFSKIYKSPEELQKALEGKDIYLYQVVEFQEKMLEENERVNEQLQGRMEILNESQQSNRDLITKLRADFVRFKNYTLGMFRQIVAKLGL
jgi:hypothetical protein